jgi:hypothetical protein
MNPYHCYTYGVAETLSYQRTEGGGWRRIHRYTPNDGGAPIIESCFCVGPDDNSPMLLDRQRTYNPDCSLCWLGFGHTLARHRPRKEVARG